MNTLKLLSYAVTMTIGLAVHGVPAIAAPATIPCGTAIDGYFTGNLNRLRVAGTEVTARGPFGFISFVMDRDYDLLSKPLGTPAAVEDSSFYANKFSSYYQGQFRQVFLDRPNNNVDLSDFWVSRSGTFFFRSITWSTAWVQLQGVTCYRGPENQTVVTGHIDSGLPWGIAYWTILLGEQ